MHRRPLLDALSAQPAADHSAAIEQHPPPSHQEMNFEFPVCLAMR